MNSFVKKNLAMIFILIAAFGVVAALLTYPAISALSANNEILAEKQADLKSLYDKVDVLQKANKNQADFKNTTSKVNSLWPDNQDVSQFMIQTENMAKSNNAVLENFSISQAAQASTKKSTRKMVQYSFSSKTAYPQSFDIIRNMENLARFNSIDSISLILNDDGTIDTSITGNIYYGN